MSGRVLVVRMCWHQYHGTVVCMAEVFIFRPGHNRVSTLVPCTHLWMSFTMLACVCIGFDHK